MNRLLTFTTLACLGSTLGACASHAARPEPEAPPATLALASAHMEPLTVVYRASGTVRGRNTAVLTSKTIGYVRAVRARPGDHVALGQPLVELEANDARASVARARAGLDQSSEARASAESALEASRAAARIAKSNFDRATTLLKDNAIPQQQYDEAEATWRSANALENMAQSRLRSVGSGIDEAKAALGEAQITLG
jgi:multidrug efflux pump subunit AcrA (membrane-fusion protein)